MTALGSETTELELANVVEDILGTMNMPLAISDAPKFARGENPQAWDAWYMDRRNRILHEDPRFRLLQHRHGEAVMERIATRLAEMYGALFNVADDEEDTDEAYAARMAEAFPRSLPPVDPSYDVTMMLLMSEIAADAERVSDLRAINERFSRDFHADPKDFDPSVLKTYQDIATTLDHWQTYYEGKEMIDSPDRSGWDLPAGVEPGSNEGVRLWYEHLWDCVQADERFARLIQYWGEEVVQNAIERVQRFEQAWAERMIAEHKDGSDWRRPDTEQQEIVRQHTTTKRLLATEAGLNDDLPNAGSA